MKLRDEMAIRAERIKERKDNPCPTREGSKEEPVGCYEPMMSGEPTWNACDDDFHKPCPTCDGDGILVIVSGDRFSPPTIPCPDCGDARFIPGKGRSL